MKYLIVLIMLIGSATPATPATPAQLENKSWVLVSRGSTMGYTAERSHFSKPGGYDYICLYGRLWYSNPPIFVRILKPNNKGVSCEIIKIKVKVPKQIKKQKTQHITQSLQGR